MTELGAHLGRFLREHLPRDRRASHHTIESYAYSFQLFVLFIADKLGIRPCHIKIEQLDVRLILEFLDHLERERGNTIRTRNARLAAIKCFFRYLEYRSPACLDFARQVHAIPTKRTDETIVDALSREQVQALLDAPDPGTRSGLRDRAMLHLTYAAGLRVSELVGLACQDLSEPHLDTVHIVGKGRRERNLPIWKETRSVLREWLAIRPESPHPHLFLNARGTAMSRHGFNHRLTIHVEAARRRLPSLASKHITPHSLRHACALHTLEATGDIRKVSLWLGHASIQSTEIYLRVDPAEKLDILAAGLPIAIRKGTFTGAQDKLMAILSEARTA